MKKIRAILLVAILPALTAYSQECFRFSYLLMHKNNPTEQSLNVNEMLLDYNGQSSFFYSETSFKRDSLNVIAFNQRGETIDDKAYAERTRLSSSAINDKSVIDFSKGEMTQLYHDVVYFEGRMPLELPQWTFAEDEEEQSGYLCRKAKGTYLGREWTIWFTEEIPVNVGPWFLWGAPGLIVFATDSENLINFRLWGVEKIEESRLDNNLSYLKHSTSSPGIKKYTMSMREMETMHTKYMRDVAYFNKINGITDGYMEDRNGRRIEMQMTRPYIPYIADVFWKSK